MLTENNGTITNVQLLMVNQLFQKFQKFADGGPRRKTEKFFEKIIIDLYELDNSKKKIFFEKKFSK